MNKVASYIGNLGKSVSFMVVDAVKDYGGTTGEFVAQNNELFKEIYSGIRNYRQTLKRTGHLLKQSTIYDSGNKLIHNIFDDIRTGNIYNKQRMDQYEMEALGMDDFDVDLDIDGDGKKDQSAVEISAEDKRARHTEDIIELAAEGASNLVANTTAKTGQYIVANMHSSDQMRRVENSQIVHSLATGFSSVQAGIEKVLEFSNGPLVTHMQNSTKYYETSIKLMQEQNAMFKEFLEMQREQYKDQLKKEERKKLGYDDVVGAEGSPDLKAYASIIKGNAKNILSELPGMEMMLGDGLGGKKGSMLNVILANPIGALGTIAIRSLIPQMLKNTATQFNESLQGLFGTIIGRFNRMAKGEGPLSYIGRLFGIRNTLKSDVQAGQYKKGPVPFDGITRNAIINVIPSHLRRIEAALTNSEERVYDSETGKWSTAKSINEAYLNKKKSFRDEAVGDVEKEMHDLIKKMGISDRSEETKLLEGMSKLLTDMYEKGGTFNFAKKNLNSSDFGIDDQRLFDNLVAILNAASFKSGGKRGNSNIRKLDSNIIDKRNKQSKFMEQLSMDGASAYGLIASGDINPDLIKKMEKEKNKTVNYNPTNPFNFLDKDGNTAYYYMRSILAELRVHRELLSSRPGRGRRSSSQQNNTININGTTYNLSDLGDSDIDRLVKSSNEQSQRVKDLNEESRKNERHKERSEKIREEFGFKDDINFYDSDDKHVSRIIDDRIKTIKIREEMEERNNARSQDGYVIKAGRKAAENYEKRKKQIKGGNASFMDRLIAAGSLGEKFNVIKESVAHIAQKPAELLQGVIESADTHLYNFFFGEEDEKDEDGNPIKGFMGKMTKELKDTFTKFNTWLNEKLLKPVMQKLGIKTWEDVPRKIVDLFGGPGTYDRLKENAGKKVREGLRPYGEAIKSAFGHAKKDVTDAFGTVRDDYYNFRGIKKPNSDELTKEERINNIKNNDKSGYGDIIRDLNENKIGFKSDRTRRDYIVARALKSQGHNIDMSLLNGSDEDRQKFYDQISAARTAQKDAEKTESFKSTKKDLAFEALRRRSAIDKYIADEGIDSMDLEKEYQEAKDRIDGLIASGAKVSKKQKSEFAKLEKKATMVSKETKELRIKRDEAEKAYQDALSKAGKNPSKETAANLKQLQAASANANTAYIKSLRADVAHGRNMISEEQEKIHKAYGTAAFARGARYITKSGITAISEGEMIIPSELNPYNPYRFSTNKAAEIANEEAIRTRFSSRLANAIKKRIHRNAEGNDPITEANTTETTTPAETAVSPSDAAQAIGSDKAKEKIVDPNSVIGTLESGISTVAHRLFGKDGQTQEEFNSMMSGVIGQVKSSAPDAVGNGLLGGTLGLLIGGPGAIMLGAAAGAAKGIIQHSEGLQNLLFGQIGDDGEREGGVVSKKLQQSFKKYFPDMKSYGIVGGLALFPFLGPIGGIIAGSAIGFAKNNDSFQNYLFGEINPDTGKRDLEDGLIGGANKEKLKKAFPAIGAGALAGLALGPFGIIGNAAVGAGVGMLSTTDKFKDIILGRENEKGEREGGVLGAIRTGIIDPIKESFEGFKNKIQEFIDEDILEPLKDFMDPFAKGAKNFFGSLLKTVGHSINVLFENTLGIPLDRLIKEKIIEPVSKWTKRGLKLITAPLRAVISAPFKFLGGVGNSLRKGQIKRGTADDMTADERMRFRANHWMGFKNDKTRDQDIILSKWFKDENGNALDKDSDEYNARAEEMRTLAQRASDAAYADEDFFMKRKADLKSKTSTKVSDWFEQNKKDTKSDRASRDRILRAINNGDIDKASKYIRYANLSRKESEELQQMVDDYTAEHRVEDEKRQRVLGNKGVTDKLKQDLAKRFGIKNINDKDVARIANNLNAELKDQGLGKVKADIGENSTTEIANILNDRIPGENPLVKIIKEGMQEALGINHKKLEAANRRKDAVAGKNLDRIAEGNSGNTRTSEEFDDYVGSSGNYGFGSFMQTVGDSIKGEKNLLQRSHFLPFQLAGGALHLAASPLRVAGGVRDWAKMRKGDKQVKKTNERIANTLGNVKGGQMDENLADKLMKMAKSGKQKDIEYIEYVATHTKEFGLTEDFVNDLVAQTKRQKKDTRKAGKTKGFEDIQDQREFVDSTRRQRKFIKKNGEKFQGTRTEDINNMSGIDQYEIVKGISKHAFGGLVKALNPKSWKKTETKEDKELAVLSAGEGVMNAKNAENLLDKNRKDTENMVQTAEENVEVDKQQNNILLDIKSQLKDIWKTQDKSLYQKITDTGKLIRLDKKKDGSASMSSDKDTREGVKQEEENRGVMRRIADGFTGFSDKIKDFLGMNKDDGDKDNKNTWFDKLKNVLLKGLGAITVTAAAGHAAQAWDEKIKPWFEDTVKPWISEKLKGALTNPESPAWKIAEKLDNFFSGVVGWLQGSGNWKGSQWSLPGIIKGYGTWMQSGLQYFFEKLLPKGVELFVRVLPNLLVGVVKGIKNGLGYLFSKWFKWGGYKGDDTIDFSIPAIENINGNSKPFTNALCGLAGTELTSITPNYNTKAVEKVISIGEDGEVTEALSKSDKEGGILDILNGNLGGSATDQINGIISGGNSVASYDSSIKMGGYTMEELTSGTLSQAEINKAVNEFSTAEGLSEEQRQNILSILSTNTVQTDDELSGTIRTLLNQNKNATSAQKRKTITSIMAMIRNEPGYYDTNGFDDEQVEEVYSELLSMSRSTEYRTERNRLNDMKSTVDKKLDTVKKDYGLKAGGLAVGAGVARRFLTGGIQNGKVAGKVVNAITGATSNIKGIGTASKAINKAGKKSGGLLGKVDNLGRKFVNAGDNFVLGMAEDQSNRIVAEATEAGLKASREATKAAGSKATRELAEEAGQSAVDNVMKKAAGLNNSIEKISTRVAENTTEKVAKEGTEKVAKEAVEGAAKGNKGLISRFITWVGKQIDNLFGNTKVISFVKKMGGKTSKFAKEGAEVLMKKAGQSVSKALTKVLGEKLAKATVSVLAKITSVLGTGGTITAVFAIGDFISGCTNAETIMGVTKDQEISWGQRLCAGLVKCVNGFITLGIVPENILYDLFIDILGPALGFDTTSLQEMRDEAQKQLDEYNLENGTNLTMEEYNKQNSWWGKTKNKIADGAKWVGGKVADGAKWVGDKVTNIAGKAKDLAVKAGTAVADKAKEIGHTALDIGGFIKDVTVNVVKSATDPEYHWDIDNYIKEDDPLGGAKKTIYQVLKIPLGIVGVVAKVGKTVFDKVKGFVLDIKDGGVDAFTDIANVAKGQYTIFSGEYWKFNDDGKDGENPLGIVSKISGTLTRVYGMAPAMIGWVGNKVWQGLKALASGAKEGTLDAAEDVLNVMKGQYTIFSGDYWKTNEEPDAENPMSMIGKIIGFAERLLLAPKAMMGWTGSKIWQGLKALASGAKEGTLDATRDVLNVMKGQYTIFSGEYWKSNQEPDAENPMSMIGKIIGFAERLLLAPKAMMGWTGSKIWQGLKALASGAKEGLMDASADVAAVASGQYTIFSGEYWKSNAEDGNPLSTIGNIFGFISRLFSAPGAMMGWVGNKVSTWFKNMVAGAKEGMVDASADVAAVASGQYTIFSGEYWKSNAEDGNPLSTIGNIAGFVTRIFQAPGAMVGWVASKVKGVFNNIISGVKDVQSDTDKIIEKAKKGDISVFSSEYWKMDEVKDNPLGMIGIISSFIQRLAEAPIVIFTKVFNKIKEKFDSIKGWFKKLFGEDAEEVDTADGKGHPKNGRVRPKYGKGKAYQTDPTISNIEYNGNTIGEAGCGPVAAANVINNIRGSNVSVQDAAEYAVKMGYKSKNDGTDPRYFNSILSASGIDNQNISGRSNIKQNLMNGNPVIIMGQGHSDQSPYGKYNPHYITAMGYDSHGNIVVDDPYESDYTSYRESDIMNGIMKSTAVGRNGFGKRGRRFGFGRYGMGKLTNEQLTALTKKAFQITNGAEGDYTTVIPNDNGSWSVGIAGFHGDAKIRPLFEAMAAKLSGNAKSQALKFSKWGGKILSSSEAAEVKSFLEANAAVSKEVQDKHLTEHIQGANFATAIKMYEAGELLDPRSIVLIGDIANTGPAHVDTWRKKHTKASSAATDLENTRQSLTTKSFWANPSAGCAKYRQGWLNRINNTYNILKDWDGVTVDSSIGGSSSSSSSGANESKSNTLFTAISDLGTSMVKSIYGEDIYNALFGSNTNNNAESSNSDGGSDNSTNTSEVVKLDGTKVSGPVSSNEHIKKAQIAIANKMYSREGKNSYSQNGSLREKQGTSNSDCSSMCSWAYRQALGSDALTNQLMGSTLPGWSGYTGSQWSKGTLVDTNKNSSKFQVGDLLFWGSGGTTSHVEMYTGDNTIMGHGSGIGPREKKLSTYQHSKPFMGGRRYITEDIAKQAGYGKGRKGFGKTIASSRANDIHGAKVVNLRPSYGATNQAISVNSTNGATTIKGHTASSNYIELLKIVIEALYKVAGNTEKISMIYEILSQKLGIDTSNVDAESKSVSNKAKVDSALKRLETRSTFDGNTPEVSDADLQAILQMMTAIARE